MTAGSTELPEGAYGWLNDFGRWVATWLFRPTFRIRVHARERIPPAGAAVLVANHSSLVEPQMIFGVVGRRMVFLVKGELSTGPIGRALRRLGQLPVHRGRADRRTLLAAVDVLARGGMIGLFPEGTRGTGDMRHAQQGAAWLVRASGAVVVPVACRGTFRPVGARRRFRPEVDLLVGEPFRLEVGRGRSGLIDGTEQLRTRLACLVRELDDLRAARAGQHTNENDKA